jgi:hypothetical protein
MMVSALAKLVPDGKLCVLVLKSPYVPLSINTLSALPATELPMAVAIEQGVPLEQVEPDPDVDA